MTGSASLACAPGFTTGGGAFLWGCGAASAVRGAAGSNAARQRRRHRTQACLCLEHSAVTKNPAVDFARRVVPLLLHIHDSPFHTGR